VRSTIAVGAIITLSIVIETNDQPTTLIAPRLIFRHSHAMPALTWLPTSPDWSTALKAAEASSAPENFTALANCNLDFIRTDRLDRLIERHNLTASPLYPAIRLAILGSSTIAHLAGAIRVAGLRHGLAITIHQGEYGQYAQDLLTPDPALRDFRPDFLLLALDGHHLASLDPAAMRAHLLQCWQAAAQLGARVIQQTALPVHPAQLGQNEFLLNSPASALARINEALRADAPAHHILLLGIDDEAARHGLDGFHSRTLWHRAKQEISPAAAPYYGDLVARLIAAARGKSAKCLVLDLDNTLWGGVIGDDGLDGIVLGQGSAEGEAFVAIQAYAKALSQRGIALAVCSKNDEANARAPFENHPEMVLRLKDIACFVANWSDKATNIRAIASTLNLGLDAMAFLDDNPAERALVRRELPMVRVFEMPEEPALVADCIAQSGWFESVSLTDDDRNRAANYAANAARSALQQSFTDIETYLSSLAMRLIWRRFDRVGLTRIAQLVNKTNQFNLTTRRYSEAEIAAMIDAPDWLGLQFRLVDRFGDNGMIGIVLLHGTGPEPDIDSWLMSCRVLGRRVEQGMLAVTAEAARARGATRLRGRFIASGRNEMVRDHYEKLGFSAEPDGFALLDLARYTPPRLPMTIEDEP
jgi:FkbH-like protein